MKSDQARSAALLAWPEDARHLDATAGAELRRPFRSRAKPPGLPVRIAQAVAVKRGRLGWEASVLEPLVRARRAALGAAANGRPRVLIRVDEFPHARGFDSSGPFGTDRFRRFHAVLAEAGIPYLLAISPRVSRDYLDPRVAESRGLDEAEAEQLQELRRDGVVFGLHGCDHRSRYASPRRRSEFCGLSRDAAARRIDEARKTFDDLGLETPVFVPPFNRFDASQYGLLAERFEVVCGGPESVRLLGFGATPEWRGESVYLPSYPPLYGTAAEAMVGIERMTELEAALWAPVTLHWGWEAKDNFAGLRRLCAGLEGRAADWLEFLTAVRSSRTAG
ncbi:MAG TPA: DUF2334 domain-containing protein [Solirubrobacterales bacterium]|nr:DUF2334 domain-containing protein [Solirubrobacterales bacterium]